LSNRASEAPELTENRRGSPPVGGAREPPLFAAALGVFAATAMLVLWLALAATSRYYPQSTTSDTWLRIAEMTALAILGLLVSLKKWPLLMLAVFLASFFPVGLYLLGVPSIFRLIGIADILYLVATVWLLAAWARTFPERGWLGDLRNWLWISSGVFVLLAGLLKAALFPAPQWNPPFVFAMITAFGVSALAWWLFFLRPRETSLPRGLIAGMLVGGLTPPLMWLPFALFLGITTFKLLDPLAWSPAYASLMLVQVSPYTAVLGAGVGVLLAALQKIAVRKS
jgi:hypothetical protein